MMARNSKGRRIMAAIAWMKIVEMRPRCPSRLPKRRPMTSSTVGSGGGAGTPGGRDRRRLGGIELRDTELGGPELERRVSSDIASPQESLGSVRNPATNRSKGARFSSNVAGAETHTKS